MIIDVPQGTEAWFQARLGRFTASDAQCICTNGKGLETLCFEKAAEVLTQQGKERFSNEDTDRGNMLEMDARNAYELETGYTVEETGFWVMDDIPEVGCSPDGLVSFDGLIEIKCPSDAVFARYLFDRKVDPKYYAQMQMQMAVTGREWVDYVVYNDHFEQPVIITRIERDKEFILKLSEGVKAGVAKLAEIVEKINHE